MMKVSKSDLKILIKEAVSEVLREERLVKESLREVLHEELKTILREAVFSKGALSDLIAESVKGVSKAERGSKSRSKPMQEAQTRRRKKPSQNASQGGGDVSKLGDNYKRLFNKTKNKMQNRTQPQPQQQSNVAGDKIKQLEQQAKNMQSSNMMQQQAAGMQPQNQQQMQGPQDNFEYNRSNPGGQMQISRNDKEFIDKLKSGEKSSAAMEALKKKG